MHAHARMHARHMHSHSETPRYAHKQQMHSTQRHLHAFVAQHMRVYMCNNERSQVITHTDLEFSFEGAKKPREM